MLDPIQKAALTFRFGKFENFTDEELAFLRENVCAVASKLPRVDGLVLFELLELSVPTDYVGQPEPVGDQVIRDRRIYVTEIVNSAPPQ